MSVNDKDTPDENISKEIDKDINIEAPKGPDEVIDHLNEVNTEAPKAADEVIDDINKDITDDS